MPHIALVFIILTASISFGQTLATWDVASGYTTDELRLLPAEEILVQDLTVDPLNPPPGYKYYPGIGIMTHSILEVQRLHSMPPPWIFVEAPRAIINSRGEYVVLYAAGRHHTWGRNYKVNDMFLVRTSDQGQSWSLPRLAWTVDYNQHAFNPVRPRGSSRIYSFAMEGEFEKFDLRSHNGPLGMRHSDDGGLTWSKPAPIRPINDPEYTGVCHMQMTETDRGTWLLGTYHITRLETEDFQRTDSQYILRSEDQGETWNLLPGPRPHGRTLEQTNRLLEGTIVNFGNDRVVMFCRTQLGVIYQLHSEDDGRTWSEPLPTRLVHPDAPPMIFKLQDDKTLIAFIHNRPASHQHRNADFDDRRELWITLSLDDGLTWSEPRFLMADTTRKIKAGWDWVEISYGHLIVDGDQLNFLFDHKKQQLLNVRFRESDIPLFPTYSELKGILPSAVNADSIEPTPN